MQSLIYNAWILTMNDKDETYHPGYLIIEEDKIMALGHQSDLPLEWQERLNEGYSGADYQLIDAQDGILMPGMINAHTHVGMIPFRSLGDDMKDRLRRLLFPLEANMTAELVEASARYALAEMLLAGITTFADMYYFESVIGQVTQEVGMRALIGETIINQATCDGDQDPYYGLRISDSFINQWQGQELIRPMLAPHATNTNDESTLLAIKAKAESYQVPVMMHVAEMDYEMDYFRQELGTSPIGYLDKLGLLNEHLLAVHCIHLSQEDIDLMAHRQAKMIHCIGANTKAAKGIAPLKELLEAGVPVGLGTDGPSSGNTLDLFHQMRYIAYAHKTANHDRQAFPAKEIVRLATVGGAQVLGLEKRVGQLKVGYQADLTLVETDSVNMFPIFDPYSALVYAADSYNVRHVWVNGRQLVRDHQLVHIDLKHIRQQLDKAMVGFRQAVESLMEQE
ncbi:amidohydrolase [Vaginisenegalia massiliensis]|uniref:amidohydrolase n=1 Tax=Vaginisenegalia massiliensis TaxID=2058294 RepID=UPI000F522917|nr:amidohydrolase [Vaginisenegalia massiliensis]